MDATATAQRGGPDFLCIGAPKAGTTWLFRHLGRHPDVWSPPVKELHYFDRVHPIPRAGQFKRDRRGLFGLFPHYERDLILRAFARTLRPGSQAGPGWAWRYLGGELGDDWYLSLFPADAPCAGEFTTDYCALDAEGVAHVRALVPAARILFIMRDPVERSWSHAKMVLPRLLGRALDELGEAEFSEFLEHPAPQRRGRYVDTLAHWEASFPAEQLYTAFYDDIRSRPADVLAEVLMFLKLAPMPLDEDELSTRVNASARGSGGDMPEAIRRLLSRQHMKQLEALAQRFPGPAEGWLARARDSAAEAA